MTAIIHKVNIPLDFEQDLVLGNIYIYIYIYVCVCVSFLCFQIVDRGYAFNKNSHMHRKYTRDCMHNYIGSSTLIPYLVVKCGFLPI